MRTAIGNEMPPMMLVETADSLLKYAKELNDRFDMVTLPKVWWKGMEQLQAVAESIEGDEGDDMVEEPLSSDPDELDGQVEDTLDGMVAVQYLYRNLLEVDTFAKGAHELERLEKGLPDMSEFVDEIEVEKDGIVETVAFRLSRELCYLSDDVKEAFLARCDLSTAEKRLHQMCVDELENFISQMHQKYHLATSSLLYKFINRYFISIKLCM